MRNCNRQLRGVRMMWPTKNREVGGERGGGQEGAGPKSYDGFGCF